MGLLIPDRRGRGRRRRPASEAHMADCRVDRLPKHFQYEVLPRAEGDIGFVGRRCGRPRKELEFAAEIESVAFAQWPWFLKHAENPTELFFVGTSDAVVVWRIHLSPLYRASKYLARDNLLTPL